MNNNNASEMKTREIIIRIDERQQQVVKEVKQIYNSLNKKVNTKDFTPVKDRTNKLWDDRNKAIGWMLGAGVSGGGIAVLFQKLITAVSAHF